MLISFVIFIVLSMPSQFTVAYLANDGALPVSVN